MTAADSAFLKVVPITIRFKRPSSYRGLCSGWVSSENSNCSFLVVRETLYFEIITAAEVCCQIACISLCLKKFVSCASAKSAAVATADLKRPEPLLMPRKKLTGPHSVPWILAAS